MNLDPTLYQVGVDSLQVNFRELDQQLFFREQLFDEFLVPSICLSVPVSDVFVSVGLQVLA